jgi:3-oxocholest-4-en-26-oyl-CoA dehydrogenase beta subunit
MAIDVSLGEDQLLLQQSVAEFLRRRCPPDVVREIEAGAVGYSAELWREMAALGWLGISIPEGYGGAGGSFLDLHPLYEELGRSLAPVPHLDTVVVLGELLAAAGTEAQKQQFLPAIAAGDLVASLAVVEPDGSFGPDGITLSATRDGDAYVLDGVKLLVTYAPAADVFLVVARTGGDGGAEGISSFIVDAGTPGLSWVALDAISGYPLYAVSFDQVVVPAGRLVGEDGGGWAAISAAMTKAAVLQTATIVGAARAVLAMTNQYAKDRNQFGGPIGRYQAVQYMVTNILIDLHRADLLVKQAIFRIGTGHPYEREAAIAVAFGKRASAHLHREAHEVHAGVAFMLEHDLTLFSRRAKFWENNLGDARYYEEQVAAALGI